MKTCIHCGTENGDSVKFCEHCRESFKKKAWRELQTLTGHKEGVWRVAYSPDRRRIISGSIDKTIRIWGVD
jgi:WD40 repeat protein